MIPMSTVSTTLKRRKFEKIYRAYVDDIYRVCLYFSRDEEKAKNITVEVFLELYKEFDEVDPDHIFARLVQRAKRLSLGELVHNYASGEVTE